jgi:hypothetical protein
VSQITFDPDAIKAAMGLPPGTERLTYADVKARREIVARNASEVRPADVRKIARPGEP